MKLGARFWIVLIATIIGAVIAGSAVAIFVGWVWYAWGFFGALVFVSVCALAFGYVYDRREQNRRKRLAA
jgi:bacteriorhodopsin